MTINLYPHQVTARDNTIAGWERGALAQLAIIPTGGGKTEAALGIMESELAAGKMTRALWLAHTDELVSQPPSRVARHWPSLNNCGIVKGQRQENDRAVTFGTRQTLAMPRRMDALLSHGVISHLVIDEAHHAPAEQYKNIVGMLREANPALRVLGITATPARADGQGMVTVFDEVALAMDLLDLIPEFLVPPVGKAIQTGISLANVNSYLNEYGDRVLSRPSVSAVFETDNCLELVVESHQRWAEGRKGIAFTSTVDAARRLAEKFTDAGISAAFVSGKTNDKERRAIVADAYAGRYQMLCNCAVFTEGFDWPAASVVHIVKKAATVGPYLQMMGRGLRLWPGKTDCLILDYVGVEHDLSIGLEDVLGSPKLKAQRENVERGEVSAETWFAQGEMEWARGDAKLLQARTIEFFSASRWSWYQHSDGWASIGLGEYKGDGISRALLLSPPDADSEFTLYFTWKCQGEYRWHAALGTQGTFEAVQLWADEICQRRGNRTLADKSKPWRKLAVSPGQAKWFSRRNLTTDGLNRGSASDTITHLLAQEALARGVSGKYSKNKGEL